GPGVPQPGVPMFCLAVSRLKGKSPPPEMSSALGQVSFLVGQSVSLKSVQPLGQQRSLSMHCVWRLPWSTHPAVQVPPFTRSNKMHPLGVQLVGQLPAMPVSQVSPGSSTPLPHTGTQSASLTLVQPGAQHPSLLAPLQEMI